MVDVTLPDDSQVAPGEALNKVWRAVNCGDTPWDNVRAIRQEGTFGPPTFDVPHAAPGQSADLTVQLTAPTTPGCYLVGPRGPIGGEFGLIVVVQPATGASPGGLPVTHPDDPADLAVPPVELGPHWCASNQDSVPTVGVAGYLVTCTNLDESLIETSLELVHETDAESADAMVTAAMEPPQCSEAWQVTRALLLAQGRRKPRCLPRRPDRCRCPARARALRLRGPPGTPRPAQWQLV
jgi:hypothetical protein